MNQLTIRGVPDQDLEVLHEEAARRGRSLNSIICEVLAEHVESEQRRRALRALLPELRESLDRLRQEHGGDFDDSTPLIRADRDR